VNFFSGKSGTQDVFSIFSLLHQNGKQVILTLIRRQLTQDIEQRLLSRFKWGLSAEVQPT
jgi:chromosomal replication initiator protein